MVTNLWGMRPAQVKFNTKNLLIPTVFSSSDPVDWSNCLIGQLPGKRVTYSNLDLGSNCDSVPEDEEGDSQDVQMDTSSSPQRYVIMNIHFAFI